MNLVTLDRIIDVLQTLRGTRVLLDTDLAALYGVTTKRLNEQVRRDAGRFPPDFCFRLTLAERDQVVAICDHLKKLKFSHAMPMAFAEHGAVMAATVLNSERAEAVSIQVVRAFIELRRVVVEHQDLKRRLDDLERRYDGQFEEVFEAVRLMIETKPRIGFR
jgi:hypothetical protein